MISIEDKILKRIIRKGRGFVMTNRDFSDLGISSSIDCGLHRLKERKVIRGIIPGIYHYPAFSKLLQEEAAPNLESVVQAIARKNQWHIQISGNAALNYLGLSTQIPMRTIYFSDGPHRKYDISGRIIEFKHIRLKETKFRSPKSEIIVQALHALGEDWVSDEVIKKIRKFIPEKERGKILKDTMFVTGWIHDKIKLICREYIQP